MAKYRSDIIFSMFSGQFYERQVSVKERNTKLLLETVTYIAIIETVMCITHCRKYCIIATETPTCIVTINIATHIFATEIVT